MDELQRTAREIVGAHDGRIVKFIGDAVLAAFESTDSALLAALSFQQSFSNSASVQETGVTLRVGLHVGDILEAADGDIYGDGVNLASRIEQLAGPGQVLVSEIVYQQIRNRTHYGAESLGLQSLKGFEEPMRVYRVWDTQAGTASTQESAAALPTREAGGGGIRAWGLARLASVSGYGWRARALAATAIVVTVSLAGMGLLARVDPSDPAGPADYGTSVADGLPLSRVAVLYFDDHSPDRSLGYLADGLTEGLIHELSLVDGIEVVSRYGVKSFRDHAVPLDSMVRVLGVGSLVEGSITRSGDRLLLTVQLIDGATGVHLESREIERDWGELFALQDSLTDQVARGLRARLGIELRRNESRNRATSVEAWTLTQRAEQFRKEFSDLMTGDGRAAEQALLRADSLLALAMALDPTWVDLLVKRGWVAWTLSLSPEMTSGSPAIDWIGRAMEYAEEAVRLGPEVPQAFELRGVVLTDLIPGSSMAEARRLYEEAEGDLRHAIALDGSPAQRWWYLSRLLIDQGRFVEGARAAQQALDADTFLEVSAEAIHELYYSRMNLEELTEARKWCDEGRRRFPEDYNFILCHLFIMASVPDIELDVPRAWRLADSLADAVPERDRERFRSYGGIQVAKVLARAGQADSARAVLLGISGGETPDWLAYDEAHLKLILGQPEEALRLLEQFVASDPSQTDFLANDWWFRPLWNDPTFRALTRADRAPTDGGPSQVSGPRR